MRCQFTRRIMIVLAVLLAVGLCFDEATAQRRRTRRSRRVTNPIVTRQVEPATIPPTQTADPQIISTADQQASEQNDAAEISGQVPASSRRGNRRRAAEPEEDADSMRRTVNELSTQVTKLSDKLSQMERQQRTLVDLERLSRAEQRAEGLRAQLRDVQEKEGTLQARMEEMEFNLRPDSIERAVSTYGSTRPEEAREARRRSLENEQARLRSQIDLFATSRQRLETAIVNADLEVERLRKRLEETEGPLPQTDTTTSNTEDNEDTSTTTPMTTPTTAPPATNNSTPPR
jgi:chromosome segregation ATPase